MQTSPLMGPSNPLYNVRRSEAPEVKEPFQDAEGSAQVAFNSLASITSRTHGKLAKALVSGSSKVFDYGSWILGMPAQATLRPRKTAIAIMNAGEGARPKEATTPIS
jgi:hypothetical protein